MKVQLSDHFTYSKLLRFVLPSVVMLLFTSTYSVIDGFFVSNYAGKEALAAVNLAFPVIMIFGSVGFMLGTGGSALVAQTLGEGDEKRARCTFSMLAVVAVVAGVVLSIAGACVLRPVMVVLGAEGALLDQCMVYGLILFAALTFFMLQNFFQSFFVAAGKPNVGLYVTIAAGLANIVGDFLLVGVLGYGVIGAAVATGVSAVVGGSVPLVYFLRPNSSLLRLTRPTFKWRTLGKVCVNGSSELMTNIAMSVVSTLYNFQLMRLVGADGVAAYGAIMYVNFVFVALFIGYSMGSAPLVSFHFGARHRSEMQNLLRKSLAIIACAGVAMVLAAELLAGPIASIFVGYDPALYSLTCHGFRIYAASFLICGFNIYGSAFFTALGNGVVSAAISFMRTLVFETASVLLLPIAFGIDGIWSSVIVAEVCALILTMVFLIGLRKRYGYA